MHIIMVGAVGRKAGDRPYYIVAEHIVGFYEALQDNDEPCVIVNVSGSGSYEVHGTAAQFHACLVELLK